MEVDLQVPSDELPREWDDRGRGQWADSLVPVLSSDITKQAPCVTGRGRCPLSKETADQKSTITDNNTTRNLNK